MRKIIVISMFCTLLPVLSPIGWIAAQDNNPTGAVTYSEEDGTDYYRAVFAHYLAVIPNADPGMSVNCAISISNVCAIPDSSKLDTYMGSDVTRASSGGFAIVLYDRDGTVYNFSSRGDTFLLDGELWPGTGLNTDGTLDPGQTYTVNLQEILVAIQGVEPDEVEEFVGYGWILSEFDCLAGTYSNTIYGLGFTQAFELKPAMGQGYQFGGLMLPVD